MLQAVKNKPSLSRLSSLARFSLEIGENETAVNSLNRLLEMTIQGGEPPSEPFFPSAFRYDNVDPSGMNRAWFLASAIEAAEEASAASGYFKPATSEMMKLLEWLPTTPFASAAMERRRQLYQIQKGVQIGLESRPILRSYSPDNLNPKLWGDD